MKVAERARLRSSSHSDRTALEHIFAVTHPYSDRRKVLLALIAYFDESGPRGGAAEDVFTLGGFIATKQRWTRIQGFWDKKLGQRVFHMSEFNGRRGGFKHWPSERRRIPLVAALADNLLGNIAYGVSHSVAYTEFRDIFCPGASDRKALRIAYGALLLSCLSDVENLQIKIGLDVIFGDGPLSVVCEEHGGVEGFATESFHEFKRGYALEPHFGTIAFYEKNAFRGLQAADMLAYEGFRHVRGHALLGNEPVRKLLNVLRGSGKLSGGWYDRDALVGLREQLEAHAFWRRLVADELS